MYIYINICECMRFFSIVTLHGGYQILSIKLWRITIVHLIKILEHHIYHLHYLYMFQD